jgi:hypothetical protein
VCVRERERERERERVFSSVIWTLICFGDMGFYHKQFWVLLYGRFSYKCVLLRWGHPRLFPNLRRMHKSWNLPLCKQLSFYFLVLSIRNISLGTWEHIKLGELPLRFFCWGGRSLKIHIEIKRGLFQIY